MALAGIHKSSCGNFIPSRVDTFMILLSAPFYVLLIFILYSFTHLLRSILIAFVEKKVINPFAGIYSHSTLVNSIQGAVDATAMDAIYRLSYIGLVFTMANQTQPASDKQISGHGLQKRLWMR
jgi:hypothetical protein